MDPLNAAVSMAPTALHRPILRDILSAVMVEFFNSYGLPCAPLTATERRAPDEARPDIGSIISLRGRHVRGGLAFLAPADLIARLLPVPDPQLVDAQVRDWCSEMANQLLGRLKNKLAAYGIDFDVGTPTCFSGQGIRLVFVPDAEGICLAFEAASSQMQVYLDCSLEPGALAVQTERLRAATEGEVMLF